MRIWKTLAAAAGFAACVSASATGSPFSSLVVFGDSLSDPGNAYWLTRNPDDTSLFPPTPPYNRRFSNGSVAAEYLADILGASAGAANSPAGGTNFAVGGAMTGSGNFNWLVNSPAGLQSLPAVQNTGIGQQIAAFDPTGLNMSQTLFLLWGAPNDFFLGFAQQAGGATVDFTALATTAIGNLATDIGTLAGMGAQHILVPNMPDLGLTPFFLKQGPVAAGSASFLTDSFNAGLAGTLAATFGGSGLDLISFDTAGFLRDAVADPASLGFTIVTSSCLDAGFAAFPSCTGYLFFDDVHPTTAAHLLLAQEFAQAVPEPETYALLLAGLGVIGWIARRRGVAFH
ncbi:MAG: lipolytic enzyme, G-D-S-L [Rhodocyclales bacterium CG_4_9_14_3_um_filter_68_10]|nr:MAG: lipolytic enzyme, G-D-S-L [Rhodocyclales bacterium CG_4_10_14_3_um_filter_68_10]PJA58405.1 MAG: lipolytic enzyme, G-D-S-L [Rhodocyclales bacterium CG_4_9_14_3_um_filter_68_10]